MIVPADGTELTVEELREWARGRIADYKAPHAVVVHPIPRNPSGKIQKHLLRAELGARPEGTALARPGSGGAS